MKRLAGKIAIVTGAASGIGAASALAFAVEGASVVCFDVDEAKGCELVAGIQRDGGEAVFFRVDVSDSSQVKEAVAQTVRQYKKIDVLFANAGYQFVKPLADVEETEWDRLMAVNLKGVFLCCKHVIPEMIRAAGGSIIASGSVLSFAAAPGLAPYAASKAAIVNLIRGIATDYGKDMIRANCICPGCVNTPLADVFFESQADVAAAKRASAEAHLLRRIGSPEEVARLAVFLASDESSFMTGSALVIDGGLTAKL